MQKPTTQAEKIKILQEWKRLYTKALIDALDTSGSVLEIGVGDGFASEEIQKHHPKSHTIIESNPEKASLAKKHPQINVIVGDWKEAMAKLGEYDAIFFNDEPQDMKMLSFLFPEESHQSTLEVKDILKGLEEQMTKFKGQFSDQEIEAFYNNMGKSNVKELPKFFQKLKENGNITKEQCEKALKKYQLAELSTQKPPQAEQPMLKLLEICLKNHMHQGSRFSGFLNSQISKYEDAAFFEKFITNKEVEFKETTISIPLSDKPRDGLIMIVEKSV